MIREYASHRIPSGAFIDPEFEYLSYCAKCKKDIVIPLEYPPGNYFCHKCKEEVIKEVGYPDDYYHNLRQRNILVGNNPEIPLSSRYFSRSVIFFLLSLAFLVINIAVEMNIPPEMTNPADEYLWIAFIILNFFAIIFVALGIKNHFAEKRMENLHSY